MSLIIPANTLSSGGYAVDNSCRFNSGSSDYLNKTLGTPTNEYKWTFSTWVKRSNLGAGQIFAPRTDGDNTGVIGFNSSNALDIYDYRNAYNMRYITNRLFRDVSAWYHIVVSSDSTLATPLTNIYINGVQETSFSTSNAFTQNQDNTFNRASVPHYVGQAGNGSEYFNGYMAETVFIDGTALDSTSFGEFDEDSGIWKPIDVSGLTFGDNGYYLDFKDSAALGDDVSGNGNDFTVNNLTAIDQTTDTPTNNFITMNPLDSYYSASTFSEGNLKIVSSSGNYSPDMGTIGLSAGKWYWEVKIDNTSTEDMVGITGNQRLSSGDSTSHLGGMLYDFAYNSYARFYNNNGFVSYGATFGTNDIIGVALDLDSGTNTIQFYKNGSAQGSKNITHVSSTENGFYHVSAGDFTSGASMTFSSNFGSPPYTISSGNTDGNG
jgi:hypothetical protein